MPLQAITLRPGINTEATQTRAEGGWSASNLIHWRDGFLEKRMGWQRFSNEALTGICRALHAWQDLLKIRYLACGTHRRLEVVALGTLHDITPLRATNNVAVSLSTTMGSTTVNIEDMAHGATTGDEVNIITQISVGGIHIQGTYVLTVVDANNYTIEAADPAVSTEVSGGAVPVLDTTIGLDEVTVTFANHGLVVSDSFTFAISTSVGGLTISGIYLVDQVLDPDTFVILGATTASSTDTQTVNGGDARYEYLISVGLESATALTGYGGGLYGLGTWGEGTGASAIVAPPRIWSLDNFVTDLLALYNGGPLYKWTPPTSTGGRATLVTGDPPLFSTAMFVAMPQLQAVCLGAEVGGTQDPLLVRYSEAGDYTVWTATAENQAGSYRLSRGSRIVGGLQGPLAGLIWTDIAIWQMQYVGLPFIYSFTVLSEGCGLIGQKAACLLDREVYWMSRQSFFVYGPGSVRPVPCAVWDNVFQDLDLDNLDKIVAAPSSGDREVTWYFPSISGGTGEPDKYATLNTTTGLWDYGTLRRTAWIDQSILGTPIGVDENAMIQQHNMGYDADDEPMTRVMAETGFVDLADGTEQVFIDQIVPDFKLMGASPQIELTIKTVNYPFDTPVEHGPFTVDPTTKFITMRARARQVALRIDCNAGDTWFRMGAPRLRIAPDGRLP